MASDMSFQHEKAAFRPAPIPTRKPMTGGKPRSKQHAPFDPEDLSRRLYVVIAEREAYAERKKRALAEADRRTKSAAFGGSKGSKSYDQSRSSGLPHTKSGGDSRPSKERHDNITRHSTRSSGRLDDDATGNYHHVPKVAASQFARTTTVDSTEEKTLVHRLSRVAMKFHKDGIHDKDMSGSKAAPYEATKTLKKAQNQRGKEYDRNQFQHPPILESAVDTGDRQFRLAQRHTFETEFMNKNKEPGNEISDNMKYRMSSDVPATAAQLERQESYDVGMMSHNGWEHRVDWTQSDENRMRFESQEPSQLRKSESKWTLRGRLGSRGKAKGGAAPPAEEVQSPPDSLAKSPKSLKTSKSGFFARFKR